MPSVPRWIVRTYYGTHQTSVRDFSLGSVQSVARNLIPPSGVYEIRNGLLAEEGAVFKRGGSRIQQNADGPDAGGVRFLWVGQLLNGSRILAATNAHTFALDTGSGTPITLSTLTPGHPARAAEVGGLLFVDGGFLWAGSLKASTYTTGTVSITQGSTSLTGVGTSWAANVDRGMMFTSDNLHYYPINVVGGNTSLTLDRPFAQSTLSGSTYTLTPFAQLTPTLTASTAGATSPVKSSIYCAVASKLLVADGRRVWQSDPPDDQGVPRPGSFPAGNYVELPEGNQVTGIAAIRGSALIFGSGGMWVLSNVAVDIEDANGNPQQSLQQLSAETRLWGKEGLASWGNAVIAPCIDNIYLVDGVSAPRPLSLSISSTYRSYIQSNYKPGLASVFANHYVLPILDQSDNVKALLTCKLDRPVRTPFGVYYPWTFQDGAGANVTSTAVWNIPGLAPVLLGGWRDTGSRLLNLQHWWNPSSSSLLSVDENGGLAPTLKITFGDLPISSQIKTEALVKYMRARYDLTRAAPTDAPTLQGLIFDDITGTFDLLSGDAPPTDSVTTSPSPWVWRANKQTRYFRPQLVSTGPSASLVVRELELDIVPRFG